jgi:3-oxoacyl-[acyl-carrier protein] reductase
MADQLKGRTVFITGSGGVLGSTYVRRMLAEGARVIASDLPGKRAEALVEAHGGERNFPLLSAGCGEEDEVTEIFQRILKDGWEPNVVLNNAAITGELLMGAGQPFPDFADLKVSTGKRPCGPT